MSATDELRRLLDERGVWHEDIVDATLWKGVDGMAYTAAEVYTRGNMKPSTKKLVIRHMATPEQAIEATLGPGTCKPATYHEEHGWLRVDPGNYEEFWEPACACSECGELIPMRKFCPNCGRKLVDE